MKSLGLLVLTLLAACAHVPEEVAWQRIAHQGRVEHEDGPLSLAERQIVEACDRFVADYPQSPHRQAAAFAAARLFHAHHLSDEATPRLLAVATASQPDLEVCELASNLVLDLDEASDDWSALQHHVSTLEQAPCVVAGRPNPHLPSFTGDGVNDPVLDRLAFLEGCWQYFHIDWGFAVCWHREGPRWLGLANTFGPMERHATVVGLQIAHGSSGLLFSAGTNAFWTLFDGLEAVPMTELSENRVRFGVDSIILSRQADGLTLQRPGTREFQLHRRPGKGSVSGRN